MKNYNYYFTIALTFMLGFFGLQEFYLGRVFRGVLGVLFAWTFIPFIISFIEGCYWLYIGELEFNTKYNKTINKIIY